MNKTKALYIAIPFFITLFGISILNILDEDKIMSKSENRNLQQKPTFQNIKEKNYGKIYEEYYTDQFFERDKILKLVANLEKISNKSTVKGYYISDDNWVLENPVRYISDEHLYNLVNVVTDYNDKIKSDKKDMYYVSTPHKVNLLSHKYPQYVDKDNSIFNKDRFLNVLENNGVKTIDLTNRFLNSFPESQRESMFFKTDHHWNSIGAYEALKFICEDLGLDSNAILDESDYKVTYIPDKYLLGSYNINLYEIIEKDELVPYKERKNKMNQKYYKNIDGEFIEVKSSDIFGTYTHENHLTHAGAYTMDDMNYKIVNEQAPVDKKLLIFRDSYHSAMSWLLGDIFKEVEIVDPRHIDKISMSCDDIIKRSDSDIVLFMFNDLNFTELINQMDTENRYELEYIE